MKHNTKFIEETNAEFYPFWLIWFINQRALYSHALSMVIIGIIMCWHWHRHRHLCTPPPGTWLDIETSYLIHICAPHMHIKYLMILTCSF